MIGRSDRTGAWNEWIQIDVYTLIDRKREREENVPNIPNSSWILKGLVFNEEVMKSEREQEKERCKEKRDYNICSKGGLFTF